MVDRAFLQDLIHRAFREWKPAHTDPEPGLVGSQPAVLRLVTWLTARQVLDVIRRHATQLPGVAADAVHKIKLDQVLDELRHMPGVRRRDANTPREAFMLEA